MSGDIPLPGTLAQTLRVNGTMTDWINPIEDCVYNYIIDRWAIDKPLVTKLKQKNKAWDGASSHHVWIELKDTSINACDLSGQFWDCVTTLQVFCVMKRLRKGQTADDLDDMMMHVRTLLIEYNPHWIAGIRKFDNFVLSPNVNNPEEENSPFQNTWVGVVTVNCFYQLSTNFMRSPEDFVPAAHSAGELSYKLNSS